MTDDEAGLVGRACKTANDGNLLVGSFAAELVGESYPFSKAMCDVVFKGWDNVKLGRRFDAWMRSRGGPQP